MKILDLIKKNKKIVTRLLIGLVGIGLISLIFYIPSLPYKPPKVSTVYPTNGQTSVSSRTDVIVNFDKPVPAEERESFYLRLLPGVSGISSWVSPTQLKFVPNDPLLSSTTYKLALSYLGESLIDSQFTTKYIKLYSEEELTQIREWSYATSRAMYETFRDYPFLEYMPIERESFNVMFDSKNEQFRYLLKMDAGVPEVTKQEAITAATEALLLIGVRVEDYGYYIKFTSE